RLAQVPIGAGRYVLLGQEPGADELLGDRRGTALAGTAGIFRDGRHDRRRIEPAVVPEGAVLGGGRRVDHELRHVVIGDDPALLPLEARQRDLAGAVVDDGWLVEGQLLERRRVREVGRQRTDRRDTGDRDDADGSP